MISPVADREQEKGPLLEITSVCTTRDLGHSGKSYLSKRYAQAWVMVPISRIASIPNFPEHAESSQMSTATVQSSTNQQLRWCHQHLSDVLCQTLLLYKWMQDSTTADVVPNILMFLPFLPLSKFKPSSSANPRLDQENVFTDQIFSLVL